MSATMSKDLIVSEPSYQNMQQPPYMGFDILKSWLSILLSIKHINCLARIEAPIQQRLAIDIVNVNWVLIRLAL